MCEEMGETMEKYELPLKNTTPATPIGTERTRTLAVAWAISSGVTEDLEELFSPG